MRALGHGLGLAVLVAAAGPACGRPQAPSATRPGTAAPTGQETGQNIDRNIGQSEGEGDDDPDSLEEGAERALLAATCGQRSRCEIQGLEDAGQDSAGRSLHVLALRLFPDDADQTCEPFEHWLVTRRGQRIEAAQLLLEACNDGYGAAGVGEDVIDIADRRFTHTRHGGSSWRWTATTAVGLSPLALLHETHDGSWTLGPNSETVHWDWVAFRGHTSGSVPVCSAAEPTDPADTSAGAAIDQDAPGRDYAHVALPAVTLPAAFAADGWRTTALGRCAAHVDARGAGDLADMAPPPGWVVFGSPGEPADASMAVVMSPTRELYIEIRDDHWITSSPRWLRNDHVELWLSADPVGYQTHCLEAGTISPALQWGIGLADGKVYPAHGKPKQALSVAHVPPVPGQPARLRIELPHGLDAITVAYSDSDDGKRVERLIATSMLTFGATWSLGRARPIRADQAVCELDSGALVPRSTHTFQPGEAVIQ